MNLRPYQQDAHDAIIKWIKKNTAPCCIEAATGFDPASSPDDLAELAAMAEAAE